MSWWYILALYKNHVSAMMEKMPPNRLKTPLCIDTFDLKKALKNKTKNKMLSYKLQIAFL